MPHKTMPVPPLTFVVAVVVVDRVTVVAFAALVASRRGRHSDKTQSPWLLNLSRSLPMQPPLLDDSRLRIVVLATVVRTLVVVVVVDTPSVVPWRQPLPLVVVNVVEAAVVDVVDIAASSQRCFLPVPAGDDERIVFCLVRNFRTDP